MNSPVILVCTGTLGGLRQFLSHIWGFFPTFPSFGIGHTCWRFNPMVDLHPNPQSLVISWKKICILSVVSPEVSLELQEPGGWGFWVLLDFPGVGFSSSPVPGWFWFGLREEKVAIREFAIILQPLRCILVVIGVISQLPFHTFHSATHSSGLFGWQLWI